LTILVVTAEWESVVVEALGGVVNAGVVIGTLPAGAGGEVGGGEVGEGSLSPPKFLFLPLSPFFHMEYNCSSPTSSTSILHTSPAPPVSELPSHERKRRALRPLPLVCSK